jgi:hypothetical protein
LTDTIYSIPTPALVNYTREAAVVQAEQDRHLNQSKTQDPAYQRFIAITPSLRPGKQYSLWWISGKKGEMLFRDRWTARPKADTMRKLIRTMLFAELHDREILDAIRSWMSLHGRYTPDRGDEIAGSAVRLRPSWLIEFDRELSVQKKETARLIQRDRKNKNQKRKDKYDPQKRKENYMNKKTQLKKRGRRPIDKELHSKIVDLLRVQSCTPQFMVDQFGVSRNIVIYALSQMTASGVVIKLGRGLYTLPVAAEPVVEAPKPTAAISTDATPAEKVALFEMYKANGHPLAEDGVLFGKNYAKYGYQKMYDAAIKKWGAPGAVSSAAA